jgi:hypothetical protein
LRHCFLAKRTRELKKNSEELVIESHGVQFRPRGLTGIFGACAPMGPNGTQLKPQSDFWRFGTTHTRKKVGREV